MSRPIPLPDLFREELHKSEQDRLLKLVTVSIPGLADRHYVDCNYDIKYAGVTYTKFPMKLSETTVSSDGSLTKASLTVANPLRVFQSVIEDYKGLRGTRISVKTVYEKFTDEICTPQPGGDPIRVPNTGGRDIYAFVEDEFLIDSYSATDHVITFQLDPVMDFDIKLPRRRFNCNSCSFIYKDPETCKYSPAGPLAGVPCKKDLASCKERFNSANFGGFPGIPAGNRRFFL